jgi:hypothetical protein
MTDYLKLARDKREDAAAVYARWSNDPVDCGMNHMIEVVTGDVPALCDAIEAQAAEIAKYHDELVWLQVTKDEDREIRYSNAGANMAAEALLKIAVTGEHKGVFGGESMEKAAQAILRLFDRCCKLEKVVEARKEFSEAFDWWTFDTYDRCISLPQDRQRDFLKAIDELGATGG